jgi:ParB family chromosome partitioning protein
VKRGGLGRGLSALIPGAAEEAGLLEIPTGAIAPNPRQPRTDFDDESIDALARSIQEVGVLQPVVVRRASEGYELVAGERRLRAARRAGLATIPAVVRESDDTEALREALIENIHREDLGPLELAEAFHELLEELGVTQEALAERLGMSRPHIANTIRLLGLPAGVQELLSDGRISAGHARALLSLDDEEAQVSLALRAAAENLSVREIERTPRSRRSCPSSSRPAFGSVRASAGARSSSSSPRRRTSTASSPRSSARDRGSLPARPLTRANTLYPQPSVDPPVPRGTHLDIPSNPGSSPSTRVSRAPSVERPAWTAQDHVEPAPLPAPFRQV